MENQQNFYNSTIISLFLDSQIYSKEAILKGLYWFSADFLVELKSGNDFFQVTLKPIEKKTVDEMKVQYERLNQLMVDFQLRQIIHSETENIRDLIVAKAFSNGQLDELPKGDISDPVGFTHK